MDHSARAGLFGSAFAVGRSYQPNLLTRGSVDQAIVTGTTAAAAYGVLSAGSSALTAVASRVSRSESPSVIARLLVAGAVGSAAAGASVALAWREHESSHRAVGRLAAHAALATVAPALEIGHVEAPRESTQAEPAFPYTAAGGA